MSGLPTLNGGRGQSIESVGDLWFFWSKRSLSTGGRKAEKSSITKPNLKAFNGKDKRKLESAEKEINDKRGEGSETIIKKGAEPLSM